MQKLLTEFSTEFRGRLLEMLWRQWTAIGVAGHSEPWVGSVIDPDALLVASCTIARYDARLFDAVLEWLKINGQFINIQRIKRMLKEEVFAGDPVLRAVAAAISTSTNKAKWATIMDLGKGKSTGEEKLFFLHSGDPLPVVREPDPLFAEHGFLRDRYEDRGVAGVFRPEPPSNLLLRLRALLGVNARCEILEYLLLRGHGSPRAIAKDCYYFPATISKALAQMRQSGFLIIRAEGRRSNYNLVPEAWHDLFLGGMSVPRSIVWGRLLSALEQVWLFVGRDDLPGKSAMAQASSLRRLVRGSVASQFDRCGLPFVFGDDSAYPGTEIIPFFIERVRVLLGLVDQPVGGP